MRLYDLLILLSLPFALFTALYEEATDYFRPTRATDPSERWLQ